MSVIQSKDNPQLLYYVQSSKLRRINNTSVIKKIKAKNGLPSSYPNSKFYTKLSQTAIDIFEHSELSINNESDLTDISIADLNQSDGPPIDLTPNG